MMRIGHGYDVHRFEKGRKCIIGGVTIPFDKGLAGHSDADVLLHAIADVLIDGIGKEKRGLGNKSNRLGQRGAGKCVQRHTAQQDLTLSLF